MRAPRGSGIRNSVTVSVLDRTAVLNGTAFAYSAPAVSNALPPVVDQHVITPLLLIGTNFASTRLAISISGVPCSTPVFINSSAVECREAQFLAIGRASIVVNVDGQVSNVATAVAECRAGYFGRPGDGACMPCPTHAWCAGQDADPLAQAGYWQSGRTSSSRVCRLLHARRASKAVMGARAPMRTRASSAACAPTCTTAQGQTACRAPRTRGCSCCCSLPVSCAAAASRRGCTARCST